MKEHEFIKQKSNTWGELESFSQRIIKKGIKSLSSQEIKTFLNAFRQCSHHLAYARTHFPDGDSVEYLNALVGKCHNHIYAVEKIPTGQVNKYIFHSFPNLLKEYKLYIFSAFGIFSFGMLLSLVMVLYNPDFAPLFLPTNMIDAIKEGTTGEGQWNYPLMSSYIMFNNISVSLRAFVLGITLGLGTIYVLFINGALLGSLTALVYLYGDPVNYWSLILPHGVIELMAIFIAGASGLIIAKSILLPGEYSRRHALIQGGKKSISLMLGVIFMLVMAGIIEGFFTPLNISEVIKLSFAGMTGLLLIIYLHIPQIVKKK